ncbi:MAG: hypothetical protein ACOYXM_14875 [Actinomycetota bacterium]
MSARRVGRLLCGSVAALGALVAIGLPALAAPATSIDDAGWWWRAKQGQLGAVPAAPPNVEPGQLLVQGAPDGATALAAIRATLSQGQTNPVLTLTVAADGDQGGETAVVLACQTGSSWSGGDAQVWDSKPKPDCSVSVQGQRSPDGATWTFPVGALQFNNDVNVILVAGTDPALPAGANGSVFSLTFEQPTTASIQTTGGSTPPPTFSSGGSFSNGSGSSGTFSETGTFAPPVGTGTFAVSPVSPALPEADQGLTATAPVIQARTPAPAVQPIRALKSDGARAFGALVLVLGAAGSWWFGQQAPPLPRKLGRFASAAGSAAVHESTLQPAPEVGGLGRFARTRTGPPPRL